MRAILAGQRSISSNNGLATQGLSAMMRLPILLEGSI